jgi:hypothetical protein
LQGVLLFGSSDCFSYIWVRFTAPFFFFSEPSGCLPPSAEPSHGPHLCWAPLPAGGTALLSDRVGLYSWPLPAVPAVSPWRVGTEPQSYFRSLCGRPGLRKSEVLAAGHNCLPQRRDGHSLGLAPLPGGSAPCLWFPMAPSSHRWQQGCRSTRCIPGIGFLLLPQVTVQKSIHLKMGRFCSKDSEHGGLEVIAVSSIAAKVASLPWLVSSVGPPGLPRL